MIIAVDFDGVIHQPNVRMPGRKMGVPMMGARESLLLLQRHGHTLIVHTTRAKHPEHVAAWMHEHLMPELPIVLEKPVADVYLDDKAVRFTDWASALGLLIGGTYVHD